MKRLFRNATLINEGRSFTASLLTSGTLIERIYEGENSFPEALLSEVDEVIPAEGLWRMKFDVRYYLVAILFILFDLEVAFMVPWAVVYKDLMHSTGAYAFWSMLVFIVVLTVGFIYEWKKGALEWE